MSGRTRPSELVTLQQTLYTSNNPTRRWLHRRRYDWIINALRRSAMARRNRVLEVGHGSGVYLPVLSELFREVVSIDVEKSYLTHARNMMRRYPNLRVVTGDITRANFTAASFDLILCSEVLEHLRDSKRALEEMHRLLRSGGTLILSTPQRYSLLEMTARIGLMPGLIHLVRWVYKEPVLEMGHINLMTIRTASRQVERAGFHIRERCTFGFYLPVIAEFMGQTGLRIEQRLERMLQHGPLDWLLWTQAYIADKQ